MIARRLEAKTAAGQRTMGLTIGKLSAEFLSLMAAKIGTAEAARRSTVQGELRRINAYHKCNCPGVDERLRKMWRFIDQRDYAGAVSLSQEWERQT